MKVPRPSRNPQRAPPAPRSSGRTGGATPRRAAPRGPVKRRAAPRGPVKRGAVAPTVKGGDKRVVVSAKSVREARLRRVAALKATKREVGRGIVLAERKPPSEALKRLPIDTRTRLEIERATRTPPRKVPRGRPVKKARSEYQTWFWAKGEMGDGYSYSGGRRTFAMKQAYRQKQRRPLSREFDNAPSAFYSNEGLFMGQVKFAGKIPRAALVGMLNRALNLYDHKGRLHDFTRVYKNWAMKYQVVRLDYPAGAKRATTGTYRKPKVTVETREAQSSKRRRKT